VTIKNVRVTINLAMKILQLALVVAVSAVPVVSEASKIFSVHSSEAVVDVKIQMRLVKVMTFNTA
jgi:hypothetical protein